MLYLLTSKQRYKLRIDLEDFEGGRRSAEYRIFAIGSSADNYTLEVGGYSGDAGKSKRISKLMLKHAYSRGVQYVHYVMHKCTMVKLGGNKKHIKLI